MCSEIIKETEPTGPPSFENWLAASRGERSLEAYECLLFTDADIHEDGPTGYGPSDYGPYKFLNASPFSSGDVRPAIVLRVEWHFPELSEYNPMTETDSGYYHGGDVNDEIAALASLALGARIKAGGISREFKRRQDPRGWPTHWLLGPNPVLIKNSSSSVIPDVQGKHALKQLEILNLYPKMTPSAAVALVRSARLYQESLWLAESSPELSWLLLVSAIEVAAGFWKSCEETPFERLAAAKPNLIEILRNAGIVNLDKIVAEEIAPVLGSTKKFIDFLLSFLPSPPPERPPEAKQISWTASNLKRIFSKIYAYRSTALHGGTPFPLPMCSPAIKPNGWDAAYEKPSGLAISTRGGTWIAEDIPMLLHVFHYIVRGALIKWWQNLAETTSSGSRER